MNRVSARLHIYRRAIHGVSEKKTTTSIIYYIFTNYSPIFKMLSLAQSLGNLQ